MAWRGRVSACPSASCDFETRNAPLSLISPSPAVAYSFEVSGLHECIAFAAADPKPRPDDEPTSPAAPNRGGSAVTTYSGGLENGD
jgi:hypothetical protein